MRSASVFRLADRSPTRRSIQNVDDIPVVDTPLPPRQMLEHPQFLASGTGPWQRKARSMRPGQSLILTHNQASTFRCCCRRLGLKTASRKIDSEKTQVQILPA